MSTLRPGVAGFHAMALGWIPNHAAVVKFGRNRDVDTASTPEDIWGGGGLYTGFPSGATATVAETVSVVSASASDASAGTGLRTVLLAGLSSTGVDQTETITLNGLTPVTSSLTWYRVMRVVGMTAGSGGTNAGAITIRHSTTTANIFAVMPAGTSDAQAAVYTVPVDRVGLFTRAHISVSNSGVSAQEATCAVAARTFGSGTWRQVNTVHAPTGAPSEIRSDAGILVAPLTDIVLRVLSGTADNLDVAGSFDLLLFPIT